MKNHSMLMLKFISSFKAMMIILNIKDSSQIFDFLKSQNSRDFRSIDQQFDLLGYDGEHFVNIIPSCGCTANNPTPGISPVISAKTSSGENFCFHRPADDVIFSQYDGLRNFLMENILFLCEASKVSKYRRIFKPSSDFDELKDFQTCKCVKTVHGISDFHDMKFPGFYFSPAILMLGSVLNRVDFRRCALDFTKFGTSMDFLTSTRSRSEMDAEKNSVFAQNFELACNEYERKLLVIQGLIEDPRLDYLPKLFKMVKLEELEENLKEEEESIETLSDSCDESETPKKLPKSNIAKPASSVHSTNLDQPTSSVYQPATPEVGNNSTSPSVLGIFSAFYFLNMIILVVYKDF